MVRKKRNRLDGLGMGEQARRPRPVARRLCQSKLWAACGRART
jgi:hypothetical protein